MSTTGDSANTSIRRGSAQRGYRAVPVIGQTQTSGAANRKVRDRPIERRPYAESTRCVGRVVLRRLECERMAAAREILFVVEEDPEVGFTARALGEPIFTEADSAEELEASVRDAVVYHFEESDRPSVIRLHFVRQHLIAV